MNVRLLRRIQQAIVKHARQFNMERWFQLKDSTGDPADGCGTAACIAGWAVHLSRKHKTLAATNRATMDTMKEAADLLGLDSRRQQDRRLFVVGWWPDEFSATYDSHNTALGKARVAVRRIEHFIKTKGEE